MMRLPRGSLDLFYSGRLPPFWLAHPALNQIPHRQFWIQLLYPITAQARNALTRGQMPAGVRPHAAQAFPDFSLALR